MIKKLTHRKAALSDLSTIVALLAEDDLGKIRESLQPTFEYGKSKSASIIQLTTNKKRIRAKKFYERLGFEASHEGMKMYLKMGA